MMRDADFGIVRARAFGTFDFKIVDPKLFLKEVAGSDQNFRLDEFADTMRSRIVSVFSDALASAQVPVLDVATRYGELGEALLPAHQPRRRREVRAADRQLHHRERVGAAGGRGGDRQAIEHGRGREPERLREVPDGQGHGDAGRRRRGGHCQPAGGGLRDRAAADAAERRRRVADAGRRRGRDARRGGGAGARAPRPAGLPDLLSPAEAAQALGVSEEDVMAIITSGELQAKKIGASYRIRRAALQEYLEK